MQVSALVVVSLPSVHATPLSACLRQLLVPLAAYSEARVQRLLDCGLKLSYRSLASRQGGCLCSVRVAACALLFPAHAGQNNMMSA